MSFIDDPFTVSCALPQSKTLEMYWPVLFLWYYIKDKVNATCALHMQGGPKTGITVWLHTAWNCRNKCAFHRHFILNKPVTSIFTNFLTMCTCVRVWHHLSCINNGWWWYLTSGQRTLMKSPHQGGASQKNCPFPCGDLDPLNHVITWFVGPQVHIPNGTSIALHGYVQQTDTPTEHETSVTTGRICILCMQCGRIIIWQPWQQLPDKFDTIIYSISTVYRHNTVYYTA